MLDAPGHLRGAPQIRTASWLPIDRRCSFGPPLFILLCLNRCVVRQARRDSSAKGDADFLVGINWVHISDHFPVGHEDLLIVVRLPIELSCSGRDYGRTIRRPYPETPNRSLCQANPISIIRTPRSALPIAVSMLTRNIRRISRPEFQITVQRGG